MWAATKRRDKYRKDYNAVWNETATSVGSNGEFEGTVDVILSPAGPSAAPKIDTAKWWGYTSQWNLLDYPALIFPVDKVDVEKDAEKVKYEPRNEKDRYNWDLWEKFGAEGYKDAPISLQFVGRRYVRLMMTSIASGVLTIPRYEDEKVIQALEIVKEEVGFPFVDYI